MVEAAPSRSDAAVSPKITPPSSHATGKRAMVQEILKETIWLVDRAAALHAKPLPSPVLSAPEAPDSHAALPGTRTPKRRRPVSLSEEVRQPPFPSAMSLFGTAFSLRAQNSPLSLISCTVTTVDSSPLTSSQLAAGKAACRDIDRPHESHRWARKRPQVVTVTPVWADTGDRAQLQLHPARGLEISAETAMALRPEVARVDDDRRRDCMGGMQFTSLLSQECYTEPSLTILAATRQQSRLSQLRRFLGGAEPLSPIVQPQVGYQFHVRRNRRRRCPLHGYLSERKATDKEQRASEAAWDPDEPLSLPPLCSCNTEEAAALVEGYWALLGRLEAAGEVPEAKLVEECAEFVEQRRVCSVCWGLQYMPYSFVEVPLSQEMPCLDDVMERIPLPGNTDLYTDNARVTVCAVAKSPEHEIAIWRALVAVKANTHANIFDICAMHFYPGYKFPDTYWHRSSSASASGVGESPAHSDHSAASGSPQRQSRSRWTGHRLPPPEPNLLEAPGQFPLNLCHVTPPNGAVTSGARSLAIQQMRRTFCLTARAIALELRRPDIPPSGDLPIQTLPLEEHHALATLRAELAASERELQHLMLQSSLLQILAPGTPEGAGDAAHKLSESSDVPPPSSAPPAYARVTVLRPDAPVMGGVPEPLNPGGTRIPPPHHGGLSSRPDARLSGPPRVQVPSPRRMSPPRRF